MSNSGGFRHFILVMTLAVCATQPSAAAAPPPPPEVKRLIDEGHVRLAFYDPAEKPQPRPGVTRFHVSYQWRFRFHHRIRKQGDELRLTILPRLEQIEAELEHVIFLPHALDNDAIWQRSLVLHELDHVSISSDPRPRRLVAHMARKLVRIERTLPVEQPVNEALMREIVNEELNARQEAVRLVINHNNRRLDALSSYGTHSLADRREFFAGLFTRQNLIDAEFPYVEEVADLVVRPDYLTPVSARDEAARAPKRTNIGDL